jgi:hypothetical protein
MPIASKANCECCKVSTTNNVREAMEMAERPSPRTRDTIVAMREDGRRRSSVFLIGQFLNARLAENDSVAPVPGIENRSVAGSEPNARQEVIGVMVESDTGPHIKLQVRSNEIDRSSDGVVPGSG